MIDIHEEPLLSLSAAAALVPPARSGKRTHLSTILRWILDGSKGPNGERVKLEAVRIGGRWMTTRSALQRFVERLTPAIGAAPMPPSSATQLCNEKDLAADLDRLGL
jgi:hypothetical protein